MSYIVFRAPGKSRYLYDREANLLVSLSEEDYTALTTQQDKPEGRACTKRLQEYGLCLPTKLEEIEHNDTRFLNEFLQRRVSELVLQVTQNCNLRCEYCAYSGSYYNRTHTAKRMSLDTALQGVDFLMSHSMDQKEVHVGFYGGEPLLEFDLIRQVVAYVENEYAGKKVTFGLTTNATLMTEEIVSFFVEKDFHVMISLDGPEELHDKHRRFVNGRGSYKIMMKNLTSLRQNHYDYYRKLSTNTVLSTDQDIGMIQAFFAENSIVNELNNQMTLLTDVGTKEEIRYDDSAYEAHQEGQLKLFLHLMGYFAFDDVPIWGQNYLAPLSQIYKAYKSTSPISRKAHPGGPCTPGIRRLFMDVEGNFYPCERVSEEPCLRIGSLQTGFDQKRIESFINVGKLTEQQCKQCWAFSFCGQCIAQAIDGTEISAKKRLARCNTFRANTLERLRNLAFLMENNVDFERING